VPRPLHPGSGCADTRISPTLCYETARCRTPRNRSAGSCTRTDRSVKKEIETAVSRLRYPFEMPFTFHSIIFYLSLRIISVKNTFCNLPYILSETCRIAKPPLPRASEAKFGLFT
jgi:hypothetical protein